MAAQFVATVGIDDSHPSSGSVTFEVWLDGRKVAAVEYNEAKRNNMEITSCAEQIELSRYGVRPGKRVDDALILANE